MQCDFGYEDVDALSRRTTTNSRAEPSHSLCLYFCAAIQTIHSSPRREEKRREEDQRNLPALRMSSSRTHEAKSEERETLQSIICYLLLPYFSSLMT
jgi:hypothetical protein